MNDPVRFIAELRFEDIPEAVRESARQCIIDATGCMLGGVADDRVKELARTVSRRYPGDSSIAGTSLTTARPWAAFLNTHSCSYFDLDDGHRKAQGHPGGIIIPVSMMLAAEKNLSGRDLLTAVVVGYEIAVRAALIIREKGGPRKGSGGWAIIGAVAAAATLTGLSGDEIKNALGLAEYFAPQAPQDLSLGSPSSMKEGMAWSAYSAITISELAGLGFDGMDPSLLDSPYFNDLGKNWEICSTYFKMYACCRFSHPVLDGLADLVKNGVAWQDIETITVTSFAKAMLLDHLTPENPVAAMYSIPFIVASFLVNNKVEVEEVSGRSLTDPRVLELAKKVKLVEDPALTRQFPLKCLARVSITLKNGDVLSNSTLSAKGDPADPYSTEELKQKFLMLVNGSISYEARELYHEINSLEKKSPRELWQMMAP